MFSVSLGRFDGDRASIIHICNKRNFSPCANLHYMQYCPGTCSKLPEPRIVSRPIVPATSPPSSAESTAEGLAAVLDHLKAAGIQAARDFEAGHAGGRWPAAERLHNRHARRPRHGMAGAAALFHGEADAGTWKRRAAAALLQARSNRVMYAVGQNSSDLGGPPGHGATLLARAARCRFEAKTRFHALRPATAAGLVPVVSLRPYALHPDGTPPAHHFTNGSANNRRAA